MTSPDLLPAEDWLLLLTALCVNSPAWVGTLGRPDDLTLVAPTRFPWLRGFRWRPVGESSGIALLDLAEPGTVRAEAWEHWPGLSSPQRATRQGPSLVGRYEPDGTGRRRAILTLVTDDSALGVRARVIDVRIRIEGV